MNFLWSHCAAQIEAAERKEKKDLDTLRAKEALVIAELEKKMKEEREEKMEYWVVILYTILYTFHIYCLLF